MGDDLSLGFGDGTGGGDSGYNGSSGDSLGNYLDDNTINPSDLPNGTPGDPPSNRWWQGLASTAISSASNIIATRQAQQRPSNQNPAPGGAGLNAQAGTLAGANRTGIFGTAPGAGLALSPVLLLALGFGAFLLLKKR